MLDVKREGDGGSPSVRQPQATFSVAREDRDGRSRYRALKMPGMSGKLGWYRD